MISRHEIEARLEEAALTLQRLPNPAGSGPRGYGSSWPEYVREARHAYGYHNAHVRVVPTAAEISRMEECLGWMRLVQPIDAKIIWMRAEGRRWREICIEVGMVRQSAWRRWVAALITLERRLNARKPPKIRRDISACFAVNDRHDGATRP